MSNGPGQAPGQLDQPALSSGQGAPGSVGQVLDPAQSHRLPGCLGDLVTLAAAGEHLR